MFNQKVSLLLCLLALACGCMANQDATAAAAAVDTKTTHANEFLCRHWTASGDLLDFSPLSDGPDLKLFHTDGTEFSLGVCRKSRELCGGALCVRPAGESRFHNMGGMSIFEWLGNSATDSMLSLQPAQPTAEPVDPVDHPSSSPPTRRLARFSGSRHFRGGRARWTSRQDREQPAPLNSKFRRNQHHHQGGHQHHHQGGQHHHQGGQHHHQGGQHHHHPGGSTSGASTSTGSSGGSSVQPPSFRPEGATLVLARGEQCSPLSLTRTKAIIMFQCMPEARQPVMLAARLDEDACVAKVTVGTKLACGSADPFPTPYSGYATADMSLFLGCLAGFSIVVGVMCLIVIMKIRRRRRRHHLHQMDDVEDDMEMTYPAQAYAKQSSADQSSAAAAAAADPVATASPAIQYIYMPAPGAQAPAMQQPVYYVAGAHAPPMVMASPPAFNPQGGAALYPPVHQQASPPPYYVAHQ